MDMNGADCRQSAPFMLVMTCFFYECLSQDEEGAALRCISFLFAYVNILYRMLQCVKKTY